MFFKKFLQAKERFNYDIQVKVLSHIKGDASGMNLAYAIEYKRGNKTGMTDWVPLENAPEDTPKEATFQVMKANFEKTESLKFSTSLKPAGKLYKPKTVRLVLYELKNKKKIKILELKQNLAGFTPADEWGMYHKTIMFPLKKKWKQQPAAMLGLTIKSSKQTARHSKNGNQDLETLSEATTFGNVDSYVSGSALDEWTDPSHDAHSLASTPTTLVEEQIGFEKMIMPVNEKTPVTVGTVTTPVEIAQSLSIDDQASSTTTPQSPMPDTLETNFQRVAYSLTTNYHMLHALVVSVDSKDRMKCMATTNLLFSMAKHAKTLDTLFKLLLVIEQERDSLFSDNSFLSHLIGFYIEDYMQDTLVSLLKPVCEKVMQEEGPFEVNPIQLKLLDKPDEVKTWSRSALLKWVEWFGDELFCEETSRLVDRPLRRLAKLSTYLLNHDTDFVRYLIMDRLFIKYIQSPDTHGVVANGLTKDQKRRFEAIGMVLARIAANTSFDESNVIEKAYRFLNPVIYEFHDTCKGFLRLMTHIKVKFNLMIATPSKKGHHLDTTPNRSSAESSTGCSMLAKKLERMLDDYQPESTLNVSRDDYEGWLMSGSGPSTIQPEILVKLQTQHYIQNAEFENAEQFIANYERLLHGEKDENPPKHPYRLMILNKALIHYTRKNKYSESYQYASKLMDTINDYPSMDMKHKVVYYFNCYACMALNASSSRSLGGDAEKLANDNLFPNMHVLPPPLKTNFALRCLKYGFQLNHRDIIAKAASLLSPSHALFEPIQHYLSLDEQLASAEK